MEKNSPENSTNVISFPGVGTFMYNVNRLYSYEESLRKYGRIQEAELVQLATQMYELNTIDIEWDPTTGEPILVALKNKKDKV